MFNSIFSKRQDQPLKVIAQLVIGYKVKAKISKDY